MARKRMGMELISNKRARLVSFEKRKKGLKKAAYELSTLCGVEIGMIIVCNDGDSDVWPPNLNTVTWMSKVYDLGLTQCRSYGVHDYLEGKREKVEKEIKKMREKARDRKYALLESFSRDQLRELRSFLRAKIGAVRETIIKSRAFAKEIEQQQQQQQIVAYHNRSYANLVESRNPYLVDHNLAYYEKQNNVGNQMMVERNGAACSEGIYNFDGVQHNSNAYFSYENCYQKEMMGMEPLMCYDMPNEEMRMLQISQGLI